MADDFWTKIWPDLFPELAYNQWIQAQPTFFKQYPHFARYNTASVVSQKPWENYWQDQYDRIFQQWETKVLNAPEEQWPDMPFQNYLRDYPFLRYWQGLMPNERGFYPERYAGRARWMV